MMFYNKKKECYHIAISPNRVEQLKKDKNYKIVKDKEKHQEELKAKELKGDE